MPHVCVPTGAGKKMPGPLELYLVLCELTEMDAGD